VVTDWHFCKNKLIVFGGYFENGITTKYNNEIWFFDLDTMKWMKGDSTNGPSPRSGFQLLTNGDNIFLFGGYSRESIKGKETAHAHDDVWCYSMNTNKWAKIKKAGISPFEIPRSGFTMAALQKGAILFGGVIDRDTDEDLESIFCNDMYIFQWNSRRWFAVTVHEKKKKKSKTEKKNRRN